MWDSKYRRTAQRSAWCGMSPVSGTGFLSAVNTSTSGSSGGFGQNDPGLRRWHSLSQLDPESTAQSFRSSLGTELRGTRGEGNYRQSEVVQWLQDAHERLDTQLECLRTRDAQLSCHIYSAQLADMTHRLSGARSSVEQEVPNLSQFEKNQKVHEKAQKLEKDLMRMRLSLDRAGNAQSSERTPVNQDDSNSQERQKVDMELCDAETRARKQKQNQATEQLQWSEETQRMLLNQIEELNQRLSHTVQLQERLTDANNKISQACLEKAVLSTQVLKLEDNLKDLKTQLTEAPVDKRDLTQEKAALRRSQVLALQLERTKTESEDPEINSNESHNDKQVNERLTCELEITKQMLETLQSQLQELTAEKMKSSTQIRDLKAENCQLIREKEEVLSKMNESVYEMEDKCCQLRETLDVLRLEKKKLQDQCLCLEAKFLEREEKLQQQEEEYHPNDAARVQTMEELKAVASHWTEKWQQAALTLQSTQEELETLKESNRRKEESESLLKADLDACKQQLELERSRSQTLMHTLKEDKAGEAVQAQDKGTERDLSESSLSWEPRADHHSSQNKHHQVCMESCELQCLKIRLAEKEKLLQEKTEALMSLETLREMAQIKISALELKLREKASEEKQDDDSQANVWIMDSLKAQLEESRRRINQLKQEKLLAVQRLQTLQQIYLIKDEEQSFEGRKDKPLCPAGFETDQQRRMINEQLKNLFKEREENNAGTIDSTAAAATHTEAFLHQDQTYTPRATSVDRWNWQLSSGLMPVYEEEEEEEENDELPGVEEVEPGAEAPAQESFHNQRQEMSAMRAENVSLEAETGPQATQHLDTTAEKASSNADLPNLGSDEFDLTGKPYFLSPDGIYQAKRIDICSPDGDDDK